MRAVMLAGSVKITADPEAVARWSSAIDARYLGTDPDRPGAPLGERYELVTLSPVVVMSWDFSKG